MPAAKKMTKRTLIAEYVMTDENGNQVRKQPGDVIDLNATQMERAVAAGVVYADDDRNAEVPLREAAKPDAPENDPAGKKADESRGSGPSADRKQ